MLIGSYFAKETLLISPLVKWYLDHGLKVTKVYEFIEYYLSKCFEQFGLNVSKARRAGDSNPSKAILAEWQSQKLHGNSSYGKCLTKKENTAKFSTATDPTYRTHQLACFPASYIFVVAKSGCGAFKNICSQSFTNERNFDVVVLEIEVFSEKSRCTRRCPRNQQSVSWGSDQGRHSPSSSSSYPWES